MTLSSKDRKPDGNRKVCVIGESGSGKTVLLAQFPDLYICDFDNGLESLDATGTEYHYDEYYDGAGEKPSAWQNFENMIQVWRKEGPKHKTFVVDSFTRAVQSCLRNVMANHGRGNPLPDIGHWGLIISTIQRNLGYLSTLKCNVVINCHYQMLKDDMTGEVYFLPSVYGKDLPQQVTTYFNNVWRTFVEAPKVETENPQYRLQVRPSGKYTTLKTTLPGKGLYFDIAKLNLKGE